MLDLLCLVRTDASLSRSSSLVYPKVAIQFGLPRALFDVQRNIWLLLAEFAASTVSLPLPDISFDCQTVTVPEDLFAYNDDDDDDDDDAGDGPRPGRESESGRTTTEIAV